MTSSTKRFAKALSAVAVCAMAGLGGNAFAVQTWENLSSDNPSVCTQSGNSTNYTQNCGSGLTMSGISTGAGTIANPTSGNSTFYTAAVYDWGSAGFGVVAKNEDPNAVGPHATDNKYGTDAMLLTFANGAVSLGSFNIGWNGTDNATTTGGVAYNDSDVSVLAWTGAAAPTAAQAAQPLNTSTGALAAGWTLIGNYADVGTASNVQAVTTNVVSSYWLISAYSSAYGAAQNGVTISDSTIDTFKLTGITTTPTSNVPEPGSLALMAIGLVGMGTLRRRQLLARDTGASQLALG